MSAAPSTLVMTAILLLILNAFVGLVVLQFLDRRDEINRIMRRWSEVTEYASILFWPIAAAWLLWKARRQ